jgi:hypothetical protein
MSELVVGSLKGLAANNFVIDVASGSKLVQPGGFLQVVSTTKTDVFSASIATASASAITGLSVSITPSSTSSKILILAYVSTGAATIPQVEQVNAPAVILKRDSTAICRGDASSSRSRVSAASFTGDGPLSGNNAIMFLDSPATTSAITYSVDLFNTMANTNTLYVNRSGTDTDAARFFRSASSITVMEVAG